MTKTKTLIVFISVLQAVLLFLLIEFTGSRLWPIPEFSFSLASFVVVFSGPTAYLLFVHDRLRKSALLYGLLVWALFAAAMFYTVLGFQVDGYRAFRQDVMQFRAALALTISWFILLPFIQNRLNGYSFFHYPGLYAHAWANFIALMISLVFTGICWLLLLFVALLFHIIDIDFFEKLFQEKVFIYPVTGLMFGLGLLIGKNKSKIVDVAHTVVLLILKGLLPFLAIILIGFAVIVPIKGLDVLFSQSSLSIVSTLMLAIFLMVTKINAVYRDGQKISGFPRILHWVIVLGVMVLPIYALLMCYGIYLRVDDHGWTEARVWAALIASVLIAYAVGYTYQMLRAKGAWHQGIGRVNVVVAMLIVAAGLIINSPLLDPKVIGVKSQVSRLLTQQVSADDFDYGYLRFKSGKVGIEALEAIKLDTGMVDHDKLVVHVDKVLEAGSYYAYRSTSSEQVMVDELTAKEMKELFKVVPSGAMVDDAIWESIHHSSTSIIRRCAKRANEDDCVLLVLDLNIDGVDEYIFSKQKKHCTDKPVIYQRTIDREWVRVGTLGSCAYMKTIVEAVDTGEYQLVDSEWKDLQVGRKRFDVSIERSILK